MSIDDLEVDLRGVFEYGQVYVALSRTVNFDQLRIVNFDPTKVKTHRKVAAFYATLE